MRNSKRSEIKACSQINIWYPGGLIEFRFERMSKHTYSYEILITNSYYLSHM